MVSWSPVDVAAISQICKFECDSISQRAATRGKRAKTAVFPRFCGIEHGGGSDGAVAAVLWLSHFLNSTVAALSNSN